MKAYAIRHIATGQFLPPGDGSTWWEPTSEYTIQPLVPRLFHSIKAAESSRQHWYKGRAKYNIESGGGWEEPVYDYVSGIIYETPEIPRVKGELEIVKVEMIFRTLAEQKKLAL
ncbi:MAG TPA: hypothetical protein VIM69_10505 [Opitutaceae bacterium]